VTRDEARALDAADPFRPRRNAFELPEDTIYLDGNSLGALPRATAGRIAEAVHGEWGRGLIRSWNAAGWIEAPARVGGKIAELIGAETDEVLVADSTSVNLYKLLVAAMKARPGRRVILSEPGNFPTDLYVAQGAAETLGDAELRLVPRERIADALDEEVAVLLLTHVHYQSAAMFDMAAVTRATQAKGALVLWDLSHSAGAGSVDLNGCNADLAVGCGYKYLNGGPGAPAFLFVAKRHQAMLRSPLSGWMGHAAPFAFGDDYEPGEGMARFLCGTPPILALAALEEGVDLLLGTDRPALYAKGQALCSAFIDEVESRCAGSGLTLATPRDPLSRGSHVSIRHPHAWPVMQALIARGVVGDFRAPDILRFGFTPLYVGFEDVWHAADRLHHILAARAWDQPAFHARAAVT
jgi:kynureninase